MILRKSKEKNIVTDTVFELWMSHFGQPTKFLADHEGEFPNEVYKKLYE